MDDNDDARSEDSQDSADSWVAHDLADEIAAGGGRAERFGERSDAKRLVNTWLTARLSLWNVAGFIVVIGTELPHGLVATCGRIVAFGRERGLVPPIASVAADSVEALANDASAHAASGVGALIDFVHSALDSPVAAMEVLGKAALAELPEDLNTLSAGLVVVVLTFFALQLTPWRPRSGWVWLPGGGGGAAIGLFILSIAPRAFLP